MGHIKFEIHFLLSKNADVLKYSGLLRAVNEIRRWWLIKKMKCDNWNNIWDFLFTCKNLIGSYYLKAVHDNLLMNYRWHWH